ncbi:hypothetical protein AAW14_10825 [Streptomyces hygroscopicus]|nr:hypothetical protein [Streptomyces hygroscopicus]
MRVHMAGHVRRLRVPADDQLALGDRLRDMRAHQVDAEHLPAALLGHDRGATGAHGLPGRDM